MGIPYEQRVGTKINHLTIIKLTGKRNNGHRTKIMCLAKCDCGNEFETLIESIISGQTSSCGCQRKKYENSAERKIFNNYKNSAKNRNYEFKLSFDELKNIIYQSCHYCGSQPHVKKEVYGDKVITNGIDRIDNNKGYLIDNVIPCCFVCNRAKSTMSYNDFIDWLNDVSQFRGEICG